MEDLWQDEGFGGAAPAGEDDDGDEDDESIETALEDGFDDPDELDDDSWVGESDENGD